MLHTDILKRLCSYDTRRPDHEKDLDTGKALPRPDPNHCSCDNCFYGRHEMADYMLQMYSACERALDFQNMIRGASFYNPVVKERRTKTREELESIIKKSKP